MVELVYGGSGSGKSEYAENRVLLLAENSNFPHKYYVATMLPFGKTAEQRILRHKKLRSGKGFVTIESPVDIEKLQFETKGTVLLECLGNLTANEMFRKNQLIDEEIVAEKILAGINQLINKEEIENLVIVSNNIFDDGIDYDEGSKKYMKALAKINCKLAKTADKVTEVVAGISVSLKG